MTTDFLPQRTPAVFLIGEHEPLVWLVSILFTDEFWQRDKLTHMGLFALNVEENPGLYSSMQALYEAAEKFVDENAEAKNCLEKAKEAISSGELAYLSPPADEWGEKPYHYPERDVNSYTFLLWAEQSGFPIPKGVADSCQTIAYMAYSRKKSAEELAYQYPAITAEDFDRLRKEPLWRVGSAIMYVLGHRARSEKKEADYTGNNGLFRKMLQYVLDAYKAGQLAIIGYERSIMLGEDEKSGDTYMLNAKVKPDDFIAWAKTLPVTLPMLENQTPVASAPLPAAHTPEMKLMFAALERFWEGYDPAQSAPLKKVVTAWLQENASRFGIELSDNLADAIDTIMRPAEARRGGLKSTKN